ncbi:dienelactone hydrolase family protein [Spirillospora sp. NPDC029432]|uniref:dienelactone hydrolase family protein n=1 Tax=Spirillospora sp. NPDC029432 TaxID=3154599 RepID=UPI003451F8AA
MESRQNMTFDGGHGYLATPPSGSGPGLIVIQEWWGLTDHIADVTDRFARAGFVALAPDLFGGRVAHDPAEAAKMAGELPAAKGVELLSGAVDHLLARDDVTGDRVGAVGFCMGGGFVLLLAAREGERIGAAVPFYGVVPGPLPDFRGLKAKVLGHFGDRDASVPAEARAELAAAIERGAGITPEFHVYPADHAFFNDQRPVYDAHSAALAWERTLEFLRAELG